MSRRPSRWSVRRIAVTALGCVTVAAVLFWLSSVVAPPRDAAESDSRPGALMTMPTFVLMLATAVSILAVLAIGWLAYRLYDDRIPAWEKRTRRKRRRRR